MEDSLRQGPPIAMVAMGGHAFIEEDEEGTFEDHERNAEKIVERLMALVERDYRLAITHGNGPQVGNLLIQQERAADRVPPMPLDVLVAMTGGSLGYILQKQLIPALDARPQLRYVVTMVTQVVVDANDPAFKEPTKPVGPYYKESTAKKRQDEQGWIMREAANGRGWRRLVPSPRPQRVLQRHMIREAVIAGHVVIACGGGGIPVVDTDDGDYRGVEAVIDKDLTSAVLAKDIGAELMIILTAVPQVYINFGKPDQRALSAVTLDEVERLYDEGQFPAGSMGPKVRAVIEFLRAGGRRALITDADTLPEAIDGRGGTHFIGKL